MSISNIASNDHPDLRLLIAERLNYLRTHSPQHFGAQREFTPEDLTIRCQRTWINVASLSQLLNGGAFYACVIQVEPDRLLPDFFFQAYRSRDSPDWQWSGFGGGFMLTGRSHVAVGGLDAVPVGGKLVVEHADGTVYESIEEGGCAIVFAPVTSEPTPQDEVIVRRFDASGSLLSEDRAWIGDGGPPPPEVLASWEQRPNQP